MSEMHKPCYMPCHAYVWFTCFDETKYRGVFGAQNFVHFQFFTLFIVKHAIVRNSVISYLNSL